MIKISDNYHTGGDNLENGIPWITPGSTYRIDELICGSVPWTLKGDGADYDYSSWDSPRSRSDLRVLEFGAGGSTIFFAKRCKRVLSFEHNESWIKSLKKILSNNKIGNVNILNCISGEELLSQIDALDDNSFDVSLVDNDWKIIDRDAVLVKAIPKLNKKKALIVLDNYGSPACFPVSYRWSEDEFISELLDNEWAGETFDSIWWGGLGTRIFHKGFFEKRVIKENKNRSARWFKIGE